MSQPPPAIRTGSIISSPALAEPIEVLATVPMGASLKIIGRGRSTGMTFDPVLTPAQLAQLTISAEREPFDGNARLFRLGIEAQRLGLAYEYDPFYLRRTKEALVSFPDPDTGEVRKLFTKREVRTATFELDGEELEFYDALTRYVEDQSIQAAADNSASGCAVGFTMAMLQRRMASSVYAVRRSLKRMRARREKILADPEAYRQEQIQRRVPDDFDELDAEEQQQIIDQLEGEVLTVDPALLREEIAHLGKLIDQARQIENRDVQTKLMKLLSVLTEEGIFDDTRFPSF